MNQNEPVTANSVLAAAVNSALGVLALVLNWSQDVTAALLTASGAWVAAISYFMIRPKVVPTAVVDNVMKLRSMASISNKEYKEARAA